MFRCRKCGKLFDECDVKVIDEYRGEFWGFPCYETLYLSPCCGSDFEDVDEIEEE